MSDKCHHCGKNEATLALRVTLYGGDPYEVCKGCWDRIMVDREVPIVPDPTFPVPFYPDAETLKLREEFEALKREFLKNEAAGGEAEGKP